MAKRADTVTGQLRAAVLAAGVRQRHIAEATGVSTSSLSRFARGERGLDGSSVDALCAYFGLELTPAARIGRPATKRRVKP